MTHPGIHTDINAEHYHGGQLTDRPALSASIAKKLITHSPLHAWHGHPALNPGYQREESDKFDLGAVAHILLLEGDRFAEKVATVDAKDWRTNAAKAHREASREAGLIPLLVKDWERAVEMVEAVRAQLPDLDVDPPLLADGKPEQTLIWDERGVTCKARLDWLRGDLTAIDDIKSTSATANPHEWTRRTFWAIGCDTQAAFYRRAVKALTGAEPDFRFLVCELNPPYAVSVVGLSASALDIGERKCDWAIERWRECLRTGEWPGYDRRMASVEVDGWQEADVLRLTQAEETPV